MTGATSRGQWTTCRSGPTPIASSSSENAAEYTQEVIQAFRATHPAGGAHYDVPASDSAAFVSTIEEPPDGEGAAHEQMVAAFEAYVTARQGADDACAGSVGTSRACMTAVQESGVSGRLPSTGRTSCRGCRSAR